MAPTTQRATDHSNGSILNGKPSGRRCNPGLQPSARPSIRGVVSELLAVAGAGKKLLPLALGDASSYPCFAEGRRSFTEALAAVVSSGEHDCYAPSFGFGTARRAVAEYLTAGTGPHRVAESDVFLTCGGTHAIHVALTALAVPGCNVLLPRPGFPPYESACDLLGVEPRYYDLQPRNSWQLDCCQLRSLADTSTAAIVVINPNNPCGAVYSAHHLRQIAETAVALNLPIIADEVYGHMAFSSSMFVSMTSFAHLAPVIAIGSLSKRWMIPGWRLGWVALCDPRGSLKQLRSAIEMLLNVTSGPASVIQAAVPAILSDEHEQVHRNALSILESSANTLYAKINQIEALKCHSRPQGSMFVMVEVDVARIRCRDDMEFVKELAREESVLLLPGTVLGMKNWVRIFFGAPESLLAEACERIRAFCERRSSRSTET